MTHSPAFQRKENEEFLDWKMRLIAGKIEGTLDIDWSEMKEVLGETCHPDHLRKTAYGAYEVYKHLKNQNNLDNYSLGKYEIELERKKLQTDKLELTRLLRETGRGEMFFDQFRKSIQTVQAPVFNPLVDSEDRIKGAILSFADIHYGKKFKSVNNEYSEEIAVNRMNKLLSDTIRIGKREGVKQLHVQNLADSIEGMTLRISQLQSLQSGIVDQTIRFSRMMSEWLNVLSRDFELVFHQLRSSNHSEIRPFSSKRGEFPLEDMERVISAYIHDTLKNNDRIVVPEYIHDYARFELCGNLIYSMHGHQLKGTNNALKDLSMRHGEFIDTLYVAHYHHENVKTVGESKNGNRRLIIVPSVMGSDEYSDSLMTGAKAGARFDVYEEGKGNTLTYNIQLN